MARIERIFRLRKIISNDLEAQSVKSVLQIRCQNFSRIRKVKIDPEVHTLVWPKGADFDPATLHDWPDYSSELARRARKWELTPA
jgi:hypothetical protein